MATKPVEFEAWAIEAPVVGGLLWNDGEVVMHQSRTGAAIIAMTCGLSGAKPARVRVTVQPIEATKDHTND